MAFENIRGIRRSFRKLFENRRCRYEARAQINRRLVEQCTSVYTVQQQVFLTKNLLLCGTTDVLVGNDTLSVFSSGTDAARIKQTQV